MTREWKEVKDSKDVKQTHESKFSGQIVDLVKELSKYTDDKETMAELIKKGGDKHNPVLDDKMASIIKNISKIEQEINKLVLEQYAAAQNESERSQAYIESKKGLTELDAEQDLTAPEYFLDPITLELMRDPVIVMDGQTFDRESIQAWFLQGHNTNPLTGLPLISRHLTPNLVLKAQIEEFVRKRPILKMEMQDHILAIAQSIQAFKDRIRKQEILFRQQTQSVESKEAKEELDDNSPNTDRPSKDKLGIGERGWTLVHQYVYDNDLDKLVIYYADHKEDFAAIVNQASSKGWRPLDLAIVFANASVMQFLLKNGAAVIVNVANPNAVYPIHLVCQYGSVAKLRLLMGYDIVKTIGESIPMLNSVEGLVRPLVKSSNVTPVWLVSYYGSAEMLEIILSITPKKLISLLGNYCYIDSKPLFGIFRNILTCTPLHLAVFSGSVAKCRLLLNEGAQCDLKTSNITMDTIGKIPYILFRLGVVLDGWSVRYTPLDFAKKHTGQDAKAMQTLLENWGKGIREVKDSKVLESMSSKIEVTVKNNSKQKDVKRKLLESKSDSLTANSAPDLKQLQLSFVEEKEKAKEVKRDEKRKPVEQKSRTTTDGVQLFQSAGEAIQYGTTSKVSESENSPTFS